MKYILYHPVLKELNATLGALIQQATALGRNLTWLVVDCVTSESERGVISDRLTMELGGDRPEDDSWAVLAVLSSDMPGQVRLRVVPDYGVPERFLRAQPICGHCGTPAPELLVLRNLHTGHCWLIGRSCVSPVLSPNGVSVVQYADILLAADAAARQAQGRDFDAINADRYTYRLAPYLAQVARQIALHGWVSRKKAEATGVAPTSELALDALFSVSDVTPDAAAIAVAEAAIAWGRQLTSADRDLSDYELKLHEIAAQETITYRETGLAASLLSAQQSAVQRALERQLTDRPSRYLGVVGERLTVTMTVLNRTELPKPDGLTVLYKFVDPNGNRAAWFASSDPKLEVGSTYYLKATVVEHREFRGVCETRLNRCRRLTPNPAQVPLAI